MEVRREQEKDHQDRQQQSTSQARDRLFECRHLPAVVDADATWWCARARDRLADVRDHLTERLPVDVGGEADDPLHVVAVDLARRGAIVDGRHIRDQRPTRAGDITRHHRQVRHVLDGRHLGLRNLDLNLKSVPATRVPPEIQVGVAARRRGGGERPADIGGSHAKLPGTVAVDLDLKRWIVERLGVLQVTQRVDLPELRAHLLGEGARRQQGWPLHGDFDGSRRAKAHHLTDDIRRLE